MDLVLLSFGRFLFLLRTMLVCHLCLCYPQSRREQVNEQQEQLLWLVQLQECGWRHFLRHDLMISKLHSCNCTCQRGFAELRDLPVLLDFGKPCVVILNLLKFPMNQRCYFKTSKYPTPNLWHIYSFYTVRHLVEIMFSHSSFKSSRQTLVWVEKGHWAKRTTARPQNSEHYAFYGPTEAYQAIDVSGS